MTKFQSPSSKTKISERHAFFLRAAFFSLPIHGIGNQSNLIISLFLVHTTYLHTYLILIFSLFLHTDLIFIVLSLSYVFGIFGGKIQTKDKLQSTINFKNSKKGLPEVLRSSDLEF